MTDPNDTRDIGPRIGTPLWTYFAVVTVMGLAALAAAVINLPLHRLSSLAGQRLLWVVAALTLLGELRPIVTPGKAHPDSGVASLTFSFAALLYWGFPVAAAVRAVTTLIAAASRREAPFRAGFNVAQFTLSLGAAAAVLGAAGIHPMPRAPWVPTGGQIGFVGLAAVAYFIVNFTCVLVAVALHSRNSIVATLRAALPYQAFVNLVLLSAAPLVVVVMDRSVLLVMFFLLPLAAVYANAAISVQRDHQALHDELTGLPNRTLLMRQTAQALAAAAHSGNKVGFLLLDLDRFKEVNDTLGHPLGDGLLRVVAYRLTHSVRPGDVVARLGGDEFAVLLPSVRTLSDAREVASRLRAALGEPARIEALALQVSASVGIALYPDDATNVEVLLQRADVAMYLAKERRTGVEGYAARSDRNSPGRLALLGDLRRGIDENEFELHYQPKVLLAGGGTAGLEALARWRHPELGLLGPAEFIPLAEHTYLMRDLTQSLLRSALAQVAAWRRAGIAVQVSLNVSVRDLIDTGVAATIGNELSRLALPPDALLLEISEQMLSREVADIAAGANALAAMGVRLSIDDFGSGYCSLGRLRTLPAAEIKIDPSFVSTLVTTRGNELIVRSLVGLAKGLGIRSVAEGVESAEVAAVLRGMGCDAAQGRHFSGPLNAAAATAWLAGELVGGRATAVPTVTVLEDPGESTLPDLTGSAGPIADVPVHDPARAAID
jgi:diguanylate cyclase (GGDEF)-like protein